MFIKILIYFIYFINHDVFRYSLTHYSKQMKNYLFKKKCFDKLINDIVEFRKEQEVYSLIINIEQKTLYI